ncbi:MAG: hypothetical protein IPQ10_01285 [Saprospiraceae bacterium]|jgi:hypothetical protein|nr:hypothetical protein [Saprospiraceae bacterium]MBK7796906.1 hypothetical protein [Saprospiraceae bacterium]MBL0259702.1 hypothetical protein [Saprospiraceae bacterium]
MGFWSSIFKSSSDSSVLLDSNTVFGRFSGVFKSDSLNEHWEMALSDFEKKDYHSSFSHVLEYLKNEKGDNIRFQQINDRIEFEIFQGSKSVLGYMDLVHFYAIAPLAIVEDLNIGLMRKSLEKNYMLQYSRYALNDKLQMSLKFDSVIAEASPYKLFYGLKEMAIQADLDDDLMVMDFQNVKPINAEHIIAISDKEKELKTNYFYREIDEVLDPKVLGHLNPDRFQGALTYVYLSCVYKLDYLLKPEGKAMHQIAKIHAVYSLAGNQDVGLSLGKLTEGLKALKEIEPEKLRSEFYNVISTFSVVPPATETEIGGIIENEMKSFEWYKEQKHYFICEQICSYLVGFLLFQFAFASPAKDLLHLFYCISEEDFFKSLSIPVDFTDGDELRSARIKAAIKQILEDSNLTDKQNLMDQLQFETKAHFYQSYLQLFRQVLA